MTRPRNPRSPTRMLAPSPRTKYGKPASRAARRRSPDRRPTWHRTADRRDRRSGTWCMERAARPLRSRVASRRRAASARKRARESPCSAIGAQRKPGNPGYRQRAITLMRTFDAARVAARRIAVGLAACRGRSRRCRLVAARRAARRAREVHPAQGAGQRTRRDRRREPRRSARHRRSRREERLVHAAPRHRGALAHVRAHVLQGERRSCPNRTSSSSARRSSARSFNGTTQEERVNYYLTLPADSVDGGMQVHGGGAARTEVPAARNSSASERW